MDDNYFDDKLKGILESPPNFQVEPSALQDMKKRLKPISNRKRNNRSLYLLAALLLLPMFLGAGFFISKYNKLNEQVVDLSRQISQINLISNKDTIIEKQTIHHYDTIITVIYREKYIKADQREIQNENAYSHVYNNPYSYLRNSNLLQYNLKPNSSYWSIGNGTYSLLAKNPSSSIFENNFIQNNKEIDDLENKWRPSDPLQLLGLQYLNIDREEPDWIKNLTDKLPEYKEPETKPIYYFIPNGLSASIKYSPLVYSSNAFGASGYALGLNAAIELPAGQSLGIGAEWLNVDFKIEGDPATFALFPIANPNDPTDVLHELKGSFSYLQIPVVVKQKLRLDKNLKPFFTAGLVAYKPLSQKFIYEYIDGTGEYKLNMEFNDGEFSVDNFRLGVGAEYDFGNKLSILSEVQYQHGFSLNTDEYFKLQLWALNFGLRYSL